MEHMLNNLETLICGLVSGFILFQSAIVAPTIFSTMAEDQAGPFLRSLFPKLFKLCAFLMSVNLFVALYISNIASAIGFSVGIILMVICLLIVPKINTARDHDNQLTFKRLHLATVLSTITVLLINLWFSLF